MTYDPSLTEEAIKACFENAHRHKYKGVNFCGNLRTLYLLYHEGFREGFLSVNPDGELTIDEFSRLVETMTFRGIPMMVFPEMADGQFAVLKNVK